LSYHNQILKTFQNLLDCFTFACNAKSTILHNKNLQSPRTSVYHCPVPHSAPKPPTHVARTRKGHLSMVPLPCIHSQVLLEFSHSYKGFLRHLLSSTHPKVRSLRVMVTYLVRHMQSCFSIRCPGIGIWKAVPFVSCMLTFMHSLPSSTVPSPALGSRDSSPSRIFRSESMTPTSRLVSIRRISEIQYSIKTKGALRPLHTTLPGRLHRALLGTEHNITRAILYNRMY
jgi:hypothetical protein